MVTIGTARPPEYVAGIVLADPSPRVTFRYTDRETRVMPVRMLVVRFLRMFEPVDR